MKTLILTACALALIAIGLSACTCDRDWYKVDTPDPASVQVRLYEGSSTEPMLSPYRLVENQTYKVAAKSLDADGDSIDVYSDPDDFDYFPSESEVVTDLTVTDAQAAFKAARDGEKTTSSIVVVLKDTGGAIQVMPPLAVTVYETEALRDAAYSAWEPSALRVTVGTASPAQLTVGQSVTASAVGLNAAGAIVATDGALKWASTDPSVAAADDGTGLVTAKAVGTATIVVTLDEPYIAGACILQVIASDDTESGESAES